MKRLRCKHSTRGRRRIRSCRVVRVTAWHWLHHAHSAIASCSGVVNCFKQSEGTHSHRVRRAATVPHRIAPCHVPCSVRPGAADCGCYTPVSGTLALRRGRRGGRRRATRTVATWHCSTALARCRHDSRRPCTVRVTVTTAPAGRHLRHSQAQVQELVVLDGCEATDAASTLSAIHTVTV